MLCILPGQNVVQEESGGPQQATDLGAYALLPKFSERCSRGGIPVLPLWISALGVGLRVLEVGRHRCEVWSH